MKSLTCGCELLPSGSIGTLCSLHGAHMHVALEAAKHPRHTTKDRDFERNLVLALAPAMMAKGAGLMDPDTFAEALDQRVQAVLRRLE